MDLSAFVCKLLEEQDGDVLRGPNRCRPPRAHARDGAPQRLSDEDLGYGVSDARSRPTDYPYLWVDAMYRKVRVHGRVPAKRRSSRRRVGVTSDGERQVLGSDVGPSDHRAF
jgi:hypothetical protein